MKSSLVAEITRLCLSEFSRHYPSPPLIEYLIENHVGRWAGDTYSVTQEDKVHLAELLEAETGINPFESEDPGALGFTSLSATPRQRASGEATLSHDAHIIVARALKDHRLVFAGFDARLPPGIGIAVQHAQERMTCGHQAAIVCQTYDLFVRLEETVLELELAGPNPLVFYAGGTVNQREALERTLRALEIPAYYAINLDPEGLLLPRSLPRFGGVLLPDEDTLARLMQEHGDNAAFERQVYAHAEKFVGIEGQLAFIWQHLQTAKTSLHSDAFFNQCTKPSEPVATEATQPPAPVLEQQKAPEPPSGFAQRPPAPSNKKPAPMAPAKLDLSRKIHPRTEAVIMAKARAMATPTDDEPLIPGA